MQIVLEHPEHIEAIRAVTTAAFMEMPYSSHTEGAIIDALREAGALTISLAAIENSELIGHAAFSPVKINGRNECWYGLGPVSVRPDHQRKGVAAALIRTGLDYLRGIQAAGCVVLGEPSYYQRFGFKSNKHLQYKGAPPEYFQVLPFTDHIPQGDVEYHEGFYAQ